MILKEAELFKLKVIAARIIIVQINHLSVNMFEEFVEEKIDKLLVLFSSRQGSSHYQCMAEC